MSAEGCTSALLHINYLLPQSKSHWLSQRQSAAPQRPRFSQIRNMNYIHFLLFNNYCTYSSHRNQNSSCTRDTTNSNFPFFFKSDLHTMSGQSNGCRPALNWYVWAKGSVFSTEGYLQGSKVKGPSCLISFPASVLAVCYLSSLWAAGCESSFVFFLKQEIKKNYKSAIYIALLKIHRYKKENTCSAITTVNARDNG